MNRAMKHGGLLSRVPGMRSIVLGPRGLERFGRHPSNSVVLDTPAIPRLCSRQHASAVFSPVTESWHIKDLDSANGTFLNDTRLVSGHWFELRQGDTVSFGGPTSVSFVSDTRGPVRVANPFVYVFVSTDPAPEYPLGDGVCMRVHGGKISPPPTTEGPYEYL